METIATNLDSTIARTAEAMRAERANAAEHGYVVEFEEVEGHPELLRPLWA